MAQGSELRLIFMDAMGNTFILPTKLTFHRQPEFIDPAIIEMFGQDKSAYDQYFQIDSEDTIIFHSPDTAKEFCEIMNRLRGIQSAPRRRFPIFFGSKAI